MGLQALASLTGSPLTDMQADELMKALDTNGDGEIDWQEFVGAFKLVDLSAAAPAPTTAAPAPAAQTTGAPASSGPAGAGGGAADAHARHGHSHTHTPPAVVTPNVDVASRHF